jgi:L-2-hydroxyglutarate oxidase
MEQFCKEQGIDHELCGKIIVALNDDEVPRMHNIFQRGQENGVNCKIISRKEMLEIEPHVAGVQAINVPQCGIVNYKQVCLRLGKIIEEKEENKIFLGHQVTNIRNMATSLVVETDKQQIECKHLINCGGLHSDKLTKLGGQPPPAKIIPFKGEYFELKEDAKHLCKNLIYPVPDPAFPFLGVHFTRMIDGTVECGPNAVLAFGREAYGKFDLNIKDLLESITYPGFQKMAIKHWKMGWGEMWRSYNKGAFVKALRRLIPEIEAKDLSSAPAGIRAQAVSPGGALVDDFLIENNDRIINVCNAPSPAATASLNIGSTIMAQIEARIK